MMLIHCHRLPCYKIWIIALIIIPLFSQAFGQTEWYDEWVGAESDNISDVFDQDFVVEKFVTGLSFPTTMTFVDNDILVLQKNDGHVMHVKSDGSILPNPILDVEVSNLFETGLLGIVSKNSSIYLYYTESSQDGEKPIANNNPKMIDYALNFRSDFGDIYLLKHCKFFLSSSPTGISTAASILGTPIVSPNRIPIGDIPLNKCDIFIPMKYLDIKSKNFLSYKEVIHIGGDRWFNTQNYLDNGIELIENTPEEILEVTKEMNERLDGTWISDPIDKELQKAYRSLFKKRNHIYNFSPRIGANFLRKNQNLLI